MLLNEGVQLRMVGQEAGEFTVVGKPVDMSMFKSKIAEKVDFYLTSGVVSTYFRKLYPKL